MTPDRLLLNSGANFAARVVSAVLNLASVPVFLRVLGGEAFGVMTFVVAVQGFLSLLDLGLSATVSREVVREHSAVRRRDLVRTLATVYWIMAGLVLLVMAGCAYGASHHWLQLVTLEPYEAWQALTLAGAAVAVRWPTALYAGALHGLERQVEANIWNCVFSVLRIAGGMVVAAFVSPTLNAVFLWQLLAGSVEVTVLRRVARQNLATGGAGKGTFRREIIETLWRTALGFSAVGALGTIGANVDRVLLARFLPVTELGLYSSIATLTGALTIIGVAVSSAAFPRLARAAEQGDADVMLAGELRRALGLILCPTVPVCLLLVLAHGAILQMWIGRAAAERGELVMLVLVGGALLNACANPFYTAAMASGNSGFLLRVNLAALLILLPYYIFALPRGGALAAAGGVWAQNSFLVCSLMWRYWRLMPSRDWLVDRILEAVSCSVVIAIAVIVGNSIDQVWGVVSAGSIATAAVVAFLGARLPEIRSWLGR